MSSNWSVNEIMENPIPLNLFELIRVQYHKTPEKPEVLESNYYQEWCKLSQVLNTYLGDIIGDIETEIKNITDFQRNSVVVAKKNPRLLSKYVNQDNNINIIKCEINKLSSTNSGILLENVINIINKGDNEKVDTYLELVFNQLINKCYLEEVSVDTYLNFMNQLGKLEKFHRIHEMMNQYLENVKLIANENLIGWNPCIYTYSQENKNTNTKLEYFSSVGRILSYLLHQHYEKLCVFTLNIEEILQTILNVKKIIIKDLSNLKITGNLDLDKRIFMIIGFSQSSKIDEIIKFYNPETLKEVIVLINEIVKSPELPYKYKYRLMDWKDRLNSDKPMEKNSSPDLENKSQITKTIHNTPKTTVEALVQPSSHSEIYKLIERLNHIVQSDINALVEDISVSKIAKYMLKEEDLVFSINKIFHWCMEMINQCSNPKNVMIYWNLLNSVNFKILQTSPEAKNTYKNNIWRNDMINMVNELTNFNSIRTNWYNFGMVLGGFIINRMINFGDVENIILINKKDLTKVYEIKLRLIAGLSTHTGKSFISVMNTPVIIKLKSTLDSLLEKFRKSQSPNTYLDQIQEFKKSLEKNMNTKSSNRFNLLQELMATNSGDDDN